MTQHDDDRLATWLAAEPMLGTTSSLERALRAARATRQRPAWLVAASGGTISAERTNRSVGLAWSVVVVVALTGLIIGGLVVGGWLRPQPAPDAVLPSTTAFPSATADASEPSPDAALGGGPILVYLPHESPSPCDLGSLAPFDLFSLDAGTGAQTLLGKTAEDCSARWLNLQSAPDGAHILLTDEFGQETKTLDTSTAAGRDLTFICCNLPTDVWEGGASTFDGWLLSPAGDRVSAIHTAEFQVPGQEGLTGISDGIVAANVDGSGRVFLPVPEGATIRGWATWSPDQSALVVAACLPCNHAQLGQPATAENHEHLYVVPADGSPVRELLDDTDGWFWSPAWSPDGSTFATLRRECQSEWVPLDCSGEGTSSLLLVDAESGSQRVVISGDQLGEGMEVGVPVWSRDGGRIAFTAFSALGDPVRVFVVDVDGTNLADLGGGSLVQWSPDGEWLLVSRPADDESFIDLWIMRADGSDARSLGTFLKSFMAPAAW